LFCNVRPEAVIPALDAPSIYSVPAQYHAEGLDEEVLRAFGIEDAPQPELSRWIDIMDRYANPEGEVTIGVVGKYVGLPDAYKSLHEALVHGGLANRVKVHIRWIDAELFEQPDSDIAARLEPMHGILVPGGFGVRGSEGKIASVRFARERGVPFFGICLGMQMACIEGARNTAGIANASTTEFGETSEPVVGLITEWMSKEGLQQRSAEGDLGGTMRLGAYEAKLTGNSHVVSAHLRSHRDQRAPPPPLRGERRLSRAAGKGRADLLGHVARWAAARDRGAAGSSVVRRRAVPPELKSKPFDPHPLFAGFIAAAVKQSRLV
jgi:CTP synthase